MYQTGKVTNNFVVLGPLNNLRNYLNTFIHGPFQDYDSAYKWAEKKWPGSQFCIYEMKNPK